jgi:WD40 repeat protein
MRVFRGEIRHPIDLLAFGPGERLAAAVFGRGNVDVWDCVTGHLADPWRAVSASGLELAVRDVGFLADGRVVGCVSGQPLQVFDPNSTENSGIVFPTDTNGSVLGSAMRSAVAAHTVFSAHSDGKAHSPCLVCRRLNGHRFEVVWKTAAGPFLTNLTVSRDGNLLAAVELIEDLVLPDRSSPAIVVRSGKTGDRLRRIPVNTQPWTDRDRLKLSPDGSRLAACRPSGIHGWETLDGKALGNLYPDDNRRPYTDVVFHPSGRWFLTCGDDAKVRVWDADSYTEVAGFSWGLGRLRAVAISDDGTLAAAGSENGEIVVWDLDL